jgi:endonuclease/exonuclease/phosphatase family metal-dependent hydrolase
VVRRIIETNADVIALQEASRRIPELTEALFLHGFDLVANTQNEALFARRSVLHQEAAAGPGCVRTTSVEKESKFPGWDKNRRHTSGADTYAWDETQQLWVTNYVQCPSKHRTVDQRAFGTVVLPHRRTVAWATLLDVRSGRHVTVATTHLTPGGSRSAARARTAEARALRSGMRARVAWGPIVYLGDFNTSRARGSDRVGAALSRSRLVDAYDQSTSFTKAWMSSSNGFERRPRREVRYGDHIDRIFVPKGVGVSDWRVVAPLRRGRNVTPMASDHHPVRATLQLP